MSTVLVSCLLGCLSTAANAQDAGGRGCPDSVASGSSARDALQGDLQRGGLVRVLVPSHDPEPFLAVYLGRSGDSAVVRRAADPLRFALDEASELHLPRRDRWAGARRGAILGAGAASVVGLQYAQGVESAIALAPAGALAGGLVGAAFGGRAWTCVSPTLLATGPVYAAAVAGEAWDPRAPLPPGFFGEQSRAAARTGAVFGGIGALAGAILYITALQDPGDELEGLLVPLGGFMLGYVVGAPIGVARFSRARGVHAPLAASFLGSAAGMVGVVGGGFAVFLTVPVGATIGYNQARR
jgi:hypothetical protein